MNNSGEYNISVNQIGPINFNLFVTTPNNLRFATTIQCHPNQLNKDSILNNLIDKKTSKNWILELSNDDVKVEKSQEIIKTN